MMKMMMIISSIQTHSDKLLLMQRNQLTIEHNYFTYKNYYHYQFWQLAGVLVVNLQVVIMVDIVVIEVKVVVCKSAKKLSEFSAI